MNTEQNTCEVTFHDKTYHCPISMVMDLIGGKWKTVILYYLKEQSKRFNELKRDMPDITEMTLSLQLKQLEKNGRRKLYIDFLFFPLGTEPGGHI